MRKVGLCRCLLPPLGIILLVAALMAGVGFLIYRLVLGSISLGINRIVAALMAGVGFLIYIIQVSPGFNSPGYHSPSGSSHGWSGLQVIVINYHFHLQIFSS